MNTFTWIKIQFYFISYNYREQAQWTTLQDTGEELKVEEVCCGSGYAWRWGNVCYTSQSYLVSQRTNTHEALPEPLGAP